MKTLVSSPILSKTKICHKTSTSNYFKRHIFFEIIIAVSLSITGIAIAMDKLILEKSKLSIFQPEIMQNDSSENNSGEPLLQR
jgi:hypothetical protein